VGGLLWENFGWQNFFFFALFKGSSPPPPSKYER